MTAAKRVRGVSLSRPIVYGNIAFPFVDDKGADVPTDHTHRWTVSVRGVNEADISYFVKKVVFKLHDTYPNSARSVDHPPFEVTETGWGEFEINIRIYLASESSEKMLTVYHHLKLHPYGPNAEEIKAQRKPVSSYQFDEVVFSEPTEAMYEILTSHPGALLPENSSEPNPYCTTFMISANAPAQKTEGEEMDLLSAALMKVQDEIGKAKEKLIGLDHRHVDNDAQTARA